VLNTSTSFEAFSETLQSNVVLNTIGWTEYWYTSLAFKTTTVGLLRIAVLQAEVLLLLGNDSATFQGAKPIKVVQYALYVMEITP